MAIINKYKKVINGLVLENVYFKVVKVEYSVIGNVEYLVVMVDCYLSKEARNDNLEPFDRLVFQGSPKEFKDTFDKDKIVNMAYKFVKSFKELKNGKDD